MYIFFPQEQSCKVLIAFAFFMANLCSGDYTNLSIFSILKRRSRAT